MATLRESLVTETPGDSIAYLTDFILDEEAVARLSNILHKCGTVVCEAQYRNSDRALALRNFHMTTGPVAELAKLSGINRLVLFHLSDRYTSGEWIEMLEESRAIFANTDFPRSVAHRIECQHRRSTGAAIGASSGFQAGGRRPVTLVVELNGF